MFALGIICALLRLQNSYRFAGITLAIVMLVPRISPAWIIALHRFIEVSIGIVVGLAITAIWPSRRLAAPERKGKNASRKARPKTHQHVVYGAPTLERSHFDAPLHAAAIALNYFACNFIKMHRTPR